MSQTPAVEPVGGNAPEQPVEPTVLDSAEDIVAVLERPAKADQRDSGAAPDADAPFDEDGERAEAAADVAWTEDAASEADEDIRPDANPVEAPPAWGKEEKALFAKLPADLRQAIARRENEREAFVSAKVREATAAHEEKALAHRWIRENLGKAVHAAQVAVEADFANVDWLALQRDDPAAFLSLDAQRKQRLAAAEEVFAMHQSYQMWQQRNAEEANAQRLGKEVEATLPKVAALVGPEFERNAFKKDMIGYLRSVGASDAVIGDTASCAVTSGRSVSCENRTLCSF